MAKKVQQPITVDPEDQVIDDQPTTEVEVKPTPAENKPRLRRFKLLVGAHVHGKDENGKPKMYVAGKNDVIETTVDLLKMNSKRPDMQTQKKFVEIYEDGSIDFYGQGLQPIDPTVRRKNESAAEYANRMSEMASKYAAAAEKAAERDSNIEKMTVAELRKYAEEEEIDLRGATNKEEILKILRGVVPS